MSERNNEECGANFTSVRRSWRMYLRLMSVVEKTWADVFQMVMDDYLAVPDKHRVVCRA